MTSRFKIQTYLENDLVKRLDHFVDGRPGLTRSGVVEAAILAYLGEQTDTNLLYRRLDRMSRSLGKLDRDQDLLLEVFGMFIKLWFAHTPRIPESERDQQQQFAQQRFVQFVEAVGRDYADGHRLVDDLVTDMPVTADDLDAKNSAGEGL